MKAARRTSIDAQNVQAIPTAAEIKSKCQTIDFLDR